MSRKIILIAVLFAALTNLAGATTYYLDAANGNDSNDGSSVEQALATTDAVDADFIQRNNRIINMLLRGGL